MGNHHIGIWRTKACPLYGNATIVLFPTLEEHPLLAARAAPDQDSEFLLKQRMKGVGDPKDSGIAVTIGCSQTCRV